MRDIKTVPFLVALRRALTFVDNPLPVINDAIETYGKTYYTRIIGGKKIVMTTEPKVIQHILQKNNKNYQKSALQTDSLGKYIGLGLLTANGDYWLRQRRLIQPGFHKKKLEGLVSLMEEEIAQLMDEVLLQVETSPRTDITQLMMELTLRVVSKSLFSTGISDAKVLELGSQINALQQHIVKEVRLPITNFWRRLTGATARANRSAAQIRQMMQDIIDERRQSGEELDDLLDMLLSSRYEDDGSAMTDKQLINEILILFVAGYETTANTLAWCLHALREDPDVQEKLYQDLQSYHPPYTMEMFMRPSYLSQVIDETMRRYPPAWILDRIALDHDEVDGVVIRKGDLVGLYVYGTHHNDAVWESADQFAPERFAPDAQADMPKYAFFPFGGGPRMCIGYHFAYLEMKISLIEFFKRFRLPEATGAEPEYLPLITLKSKEPIFMDLRVKSDKKAGAAL